jgi:adenylate cyclase
VSEPRGLTRRRAALLAGDVASYTRHMARDDAGTAERVQALRALAAKLAESRGGRLVDAVGDNVLVEAPEAQAALAIARELSADLASARALDPDGLALRLGIHVGDVLCDGAGQLYGDDVNTAARLQRFADPGGVVLSAQAHAQLGMAIHSECEFAGEFVVKNRERPIGVFRLVVLGEAPRAARGDSTWFGRPALAVLPFADPAAHAGDFFARGLVADLAGALARSKRFAVVASSLPLAHASAPISTEQAVRDLGVRYVLTGAVRRAASQLRVSAQLVDGDGGRLLWSGSYDRSAASVFALQDEICGAIASAVLPGVMAAETSRVLKLERDLDAWESYHRGVWHYYRVERADNAEALRWFERAAELEPTWGVPHGGVALARLQQIAYGFTSDVGASAAAGLEAGARAVALAPDDPDALNAQGWMLAIARRYAEAESALERAIELNPSLAPAYHGLGFIHSMCDRPEHAIAALKHAERLSPRDPDLHFVQGHLAQALFQSGRYPEAITAVRRCLQLRSGYGFLYLLGATCGLAGRIDEGRSAVAEARAKFPEVGVDQLRVFLSESLFELHVEGLARLGA